VPLGGAFTGAANIGFGDSCGRCRSPSFLLLVSSLVLARVQILGTKLTDEELQMQDDTLKLLETLMRDMEALFYKDKATGGNNRLASRAKAELDADRQGNACPSVPPSSFPYLSCLVA
jgi:hypothetical protein